MNVVHLARRLAGSLRPGGPRAADDDWARSHLLEGERALWVRMADADRRHAVGVARRVVASLGPGTPRAVVAAALLHDVGKIEAGLGTWRRVVATVAGVASHRARRSDGPIGRYLRHGDLGAELLAGANSSPLTVAWAREHHLPRRLWTVDADVAVALKAADDD